jgi:N-methylhydantoinase A/oxoprolinase/acetone carboxylase beta subunit
VNVPIDGRGARWLATTTTAFHTLHERLYGFSVPDEPVEVVNVRLRAIGRLHRNERNGTARNGGSAHRAEPVATRLVGFGPGKDGRARALPAQRSSSRATRPCSFRPATVSGRTPMAIC